MATIKSFTSLEQSRKLAEILPLESADMFYWCADHYPKEDWIIEVGTLDDNYECICAWSLAALINIMPNGIVMNKDSQNGKYHFSSTHIGTHITADNPIDACYEVVLKLYEEGYYGEQKT